MNLCFVSSKSLLPSPRNLFTAPFCLNFRLIKFNLVRFVFYSSSAAHHRQSNHDRFILSKGNKTITIRDFINGLNRKINSSNRLCQNLILTTPKDNFDPVTSVNVSSDSFDSLVMDSDVLTTVIHYISHRPLMVLRIFWWVEGQEGFKHSEVLFCSVLDSLVQNKFMDDAYKVAARVVSLKMHTVAHCLAYGYLKEDVARQILDLLLELYFKESDIDRSLDIFYMMLENGILPHVRNCNRILRMLGGRDAVGKAKEVYDLMGQFGIRHTVVTYNILLGLFFREGAIDVAYKFLQEMVGKGCSPNDVTYNVMINGLSKKHMFDDAKKFFNEMVRKGLKISSYSYSPLIIGYCQSGRLDLALGLAQEMENMGAPPAISTYNALMYRYCRQGKVNFAMQWIPVMLKKGLELDVMSYNILIYGYCKLGYMYEALSLLSQMKERDVNPSAVTYNTIIDGYSRFGYLECAKQLKVEMKACGICPNVITYTILMNGYYRTRNMEIGMQVYDQMLEAGLKPDDIAYNNMIAVKLKLKLRDSSLREILHQKFPRHIITYNVLVDGISSLGYVKEASQLMKEMEVYGIQPDHYTHTSIIQAQLKLGKFEKAVRLLNRMRLKVAPTVVTYTILIHAFAGKGLLEQAKKCFLEMQNDSILPNVITYNALINGLCRFGQMEEAYRYFDEMQHKGLLPNKYTYTILIDHNNNCGNLTEVFQLYKDMLHRNIQGDVLTYGALIKFKGTFIS